MFAMPLSDFLTSQNSLDSAMFPDSLPPMCSDATLDVFTCPILWAIAVHSLSALMCPLSHAGRHILS